MSEDTRRPWRAERDPCHYHSLSSIVDAKGRAVAEVTGLTYTEQEERTLLIIRSVNALPACIKVLTQYVINDEERYRELDRHERKSAGGVEQKTRIDAARSALALARGETK